VFLKTDIHNGEYIEVVSKNEKKPAEVFSIAGNHEKAEKRSVLHHRD